MNDKTRIRMAKFEGYRHFEAGEGGDYEDRASVYVPTRGRVYKEHFKYDMLPEYDNDNDLDRFIRAMSPVQRAAYVFELMNTLHVGGLKSWSLLNIGEMLVATVEQKQKVITSLMEQGERELWEH